MSLTAIAWCILFLYLVYKSTQRPVWAVSLYLLTFYAQPRYWWWGKGFLDSLSERWSLIASLILLLVQLLNHKLTSRDQLSRIAFLMLGLYVLDAFLVDALFASNPKRSAENFTLLWKQALLCYLVRYTVLTREDMLVFFMSILLGSAYVGYEVVINGAGRMVKGRLEINCAPDASDSNTVAALLLLALPICGFLLLSKIRWRYRLSALAATPFILDTILRCNSRGAFLAAGAMAGWLLVFAPGVVRRRALLLVGLGAVAVLLQAKDAKIWNRFDTTFAAAEDRDAAAESRLQFWQLALKMIGEHPLGSGGEAAFASDLGMKYISHLGYVEYRAVHNGFLDIAASWGVQGFAIYMGMLALVCFSLFRRSRQVVKLKRVDDSFMAVTIQVMLIGQLCTGMFISTLDAEWFFWIIAISLAFINITDPELQPDNAVAAVDDGPSAHVEDTGQPGQAVS